MKSRRRNRRTTGGNDKISVSDRDAVVNGRQACIVVPRYVVDLRKNVSRVLYSPRRDVVVTAGPFYSPGVLSVNHASTFSRFSNVVCGQLRQRAPLSRPRSFLNERRTSAPAAQPVFLVRQSRCVADVRMGTDQTNGR